MTRSNILLVILDSVRAKNCGIYGHVNRNTPFLNEFAEECFVFEQARSPGTESIASHTSIFSGYHVDEHMATGYSSNITVESSIWHELGSEHGYSTGLFSPNAIVTESSNLHAPFDETSGPVREGYKKPLSSGISPDDFRGGVSPTEFFTECLSHNSPVQSIANGLHYKFTSGRSQAHDPHKERAEVYVDKFKEWVKNRQGPWAGCINLMDAHYPYVPEPEFNRWGSESIQSMHDDMGSLHHEFLEGRPWGELRAIESLYDGCILQMDSAIEDLVTFLTDRGFLENTTLIITSDHGEAFGERSEVNSDVRLISHNWGISEVQTHVPLLVREPDQQTGERVSQLASLTQFPRVARTAIRGQSDATAFVPESGVVLASNYNVQPPGDGLPVKASNREQYFGPWRAAYRSEGGRVVKYANHDNKEMKIRVRDAQTVYRMDDSDEDVVRDLFEKEISNNVDILSEEGQEMSQQTQERLEDLGYL